MYHRTETGRTNVMEDGGVPEWEGWISAEEAANIYGRAVGGEVSADLFRDWLREDREPVIGFVREHWMDRWRIDKAAMLDELERRARLILSVVDEEREKGEK